MMVIYNGNRSYLFLSFYRWYVAVGAGYHAFHVWLGMG